MKVGILGLVQSRNGTLSLIVLACATALCGFGKIDGTSYAAVVGSVVAIYTFTRAHYAPSLPERGQP